MGSEGHVQEKIKKVENEERELGNYYWKMRGYYWNHRTFDKREYKRRKMIRYGSDLLLENGKVTMRLQEESGKGVLSH